MSLGENFKHRGVGMIMAEGQQRPSGQAVRKAKHVAEKKGLKPKSPPSTTSRPTSASNSTTTTAVNSPAPSRPPSPAPGGLGGEGEGKSEVGQVKGELGMPATAAATAASVGGAATRGDACEFISTYGNINVYEAGERMIGSAGIQESCCVT